VEVLVCTQDWLRGIPFSIPFYKDPKELDKFEQGEFIWKLYIFCSLYFKFLKMMIFFVDITSQDEVEPSSAINLDDWRYFNILMLFMGELMY